MRILHSVHSVDPRGGGVVEAMRQVSAVHQQAGHTIEVLSLDPASADWGANVFPGAVHTLGTRQSSYGYSALMGPWLQQNASRFDAVVVNGLWQYSSFGVWRVLRLTRTPYFVIPHGMLDPWFKRTYPLKHLKKYVYWLACERGVLRDARAVIFTSEEERESARESFWPYTCHEAIAPLGIASPSGSPDEQRSAFFEAFPNLHKQRILLFLGRLHEKKGVDLLIRAFAKLLSWLSPLPPNFQPLHLVIAGPCADPDYLESLKALAAAECSASAFHLSPSAFPISFLPMLSGDLKWGAFRAADAFILPSHQENFGLAVAEALACGVPVLISNKVNIWREIVNDGAGLVEDDTLDGTENLLKRWESPDLKTQSREIRVRARRCFENRFEAKCAAQRMIQVIEENVR